MLDKTEKVILAGNKLSEGTLKLHSSIRYETKTKSPRKFYNLDPYDNCLYELESVLSPNVNSLSIYSDYGWEEHTLASLFYLKDWSPYFPHNMSIYLIFNTRSYKGKNDKKSFDGVFITSK